MQGQGWIYRQHVYIDSKRFKPRKGQDLFERISLSIFRPVKRSSKNSSGKRNIETYPTTFPRTLSDQKVNSTFCWNAIRSANGVINSIPKQRIPICISCSCSAMVERENTMRSK